MDNKFFPLLFFSSSFIFIFDSFLSFVILLKWSYIYIYFRNKKVLFRNSWTVFLKPYSPFISPSFFFVVSLTPFSSFFLSLFSPLLFYFIPWKYLILTIGTINIAWPHSSIRRRKTAQLCVQYLQNLKLLGLNFENNCSSDKASRLFGSISLLLQELWVILTKFHQYRNSQILY